MQYTKLRKDFINVIQEVFDSDEHISSKLNIDEFTKTYLDKIVKRLKQPNGKYKFTREEYQTSIRLYFLYFCCNNLYFSL